MFFKTDYLISKQVNWLKEIFELRFHDGSGSDVVYSVPEKIDNIETQVSSLLQFPLHREATELMKFSNELLSRSKDVTPILNKLIHFELERYKEKKGSQSESFLPDSFLEEKLKKKYEINYYMFQVEEWEKKLQQAYADIMTGKISIEQAKELLVGMPNWATLTVPLERRKDCHTYVQEEYKDQTKKWQAEWLEE